MMEFMPKKPKKRTLERLNAIKGAYNDMLNGALLSNVMSKLQNGEYEGSRPYKYKEGYLIFLEAKNLIKYDFEVERPFLKEQLYMYLMDIYADCRESKDRYNAIQAINSIAKLTGITDKQQINIESTGDVKISFGFNGEEEKTNTDGD